MGHPSIENRTPFAVEPLHLLDESGRPLFVPLLKGTFSVRPGGTVALGEDQVPVNLAGTPWGDDSGCSSYKFEPEVAFHKPATDVVFIGHACAPRANIGEMFVYLRVGPLEKQLAVFGDRAFYRQRDRFTISSPAPFERIPLVYERAFGGWDRNSPDPRQHACDARNPVGVGFSVGPSVVDGAPLPNVEDPRNRLFAPGQRPPPAGVGFVSPHWQPRAALAGTYDSAWQKERAPLLPRDFDRRHMNAASSGLVAPGYLSGNERVETMGMVPEGAFSFSLPALAPPSVCVSLRGRGDTTLVTNLDTIIVEPDLRRFCLLWRASMVLPNGPHDVASVVLGA